MKDSLRGELLKLITTRAIIGLLVGEVAVVLLTAASTVASAKPQSLVGPLHEQVFFLLVAMNVGIFSLIIGMRTVTDEYRHATIMHAFLSDPGRGRTVTAKAVVSALAAVAMAVVSLSVMAVAALALASAKGGALTFARSDVGAAAGFLLATALWAIAGVGVAFLVRHQVAAIVGGVVWVYVIENLGSGLLGDAGDFLPGQAAYALSQAEALGSTSGAATAAVVLTLYAMVLFMVGLVATQRRDIVA